MSQHLDIACAPKGKTPLSCIDVNGNVESVICDDLLISCSVATHQYVSRLAMSMFTIYHQGFFYSVRRNPSLNCFHRCRSLAILGHAGPRWRIRLFLHLVLGLPCRLVHSRGVHSVTLFVHLLSLNRTMCPAHPCIPLYSYVYVHSFYHPRPVVSQLVTRHSFLLSS